MRKVDQLLDEYGESHQTKFNKLIHYVCVPAIVFSVVGLLACIPLGFLARMLPASLAPYAHLGSVLIVLSLLFYLRLSIPLAIGMFFYSVLVLWGNYQIVAAGLPLWLVSVAIFVVAWIFQFIGHNHEGKKPSFLKDVQFLMVGPAWILGFVFRKWGIPY
ncbi:DUF962 domain-containing protein [uncultured Microscilla sp.]|uniref:Mpo1 family 2-hydroxy fatty acid dioxygenase n=1 Tax=uncultured Microscilla sp. TaxID=432653 RepID=UPI00260FA9C9|nr:Mpo1-like protein [uncultured Microscilla sp.]